MQNKKIIFLGASARSGSSIFESFIAENSGALVVGEARWFWKRGVLERERCSCGQWFDQCTLWGKTSLSKNRELALKMESNKLYFDKAMNILPLFIKILQTQKWKKNWFEYSSGLKLLYSEFANHRDLVIDSSKRPFYFLVLKKALPNNFELLFVNFRRNSLGVANSWGKEKIRVESRNQEKMTQNGLFKASMYWNAYIIICHFIAVTYKKSINVKYEDFCKSPNKTISRVLVNFNISNNGLSKVLNHSVSGNPSRFSNEKKVLEDVGWKKRTFLWKVSVYILTLPGKLFLWFK